MSREVMQQVLDAWDNGTVDDMPPIIDRLRAELAKPAAVPDGWVKTVAYAYGAGYECAHNRTVEGFYSADSASAAWEWVGDNEDELRAMLTAAEGRLCD